MMPFADSGDARIFWRACGRGEPLLLIMGLGYTSEMWHHVEPGLAERFRVIVFDNRGIGRSGTTPGPHLMSTMADDAVSVLDAAGVDTAHVLGVSMGGYIAQELALRHQERVRCLILGSTACGGEHLVIADQEVLDVFKAREQMSPEQGVRALVPYIYDPSTPAERIEADLAIRLRSYPSAETYLAQLEGIARFDTFDRLEQLRIPTLVIHGEHDRLVPPGNGRVLADRIPGARLVMLPDASHIFFTDRPAETVAAVLDFVSRHRGAG